MANYGKILAYNYDLDSYIELRVTGSRLRFNYISEGDCDFYGNLITHKSITHRFRNISAAYTITDYDYQINCTANTFTVTLPTAVGIRGRIYSIKNSGIGVITVACDGAETIDGSAAQTLNQYDNIMIISTGANWIII